MRPASRSCIWNPSLFISLLVRTAVMVSMQGCLSAQSTGITTGDVKGKVHLTGSREVPSGVTLTLHASGTGAVRHLGVNPKGEFGFLFLPAGGYSLTVEAEGCATRILPGLHVRIGTVLSLDIAMAPHSSDLLIEAPGVDPQRTQVSTVIEPVLIDELPIQRRSFVNFSLTVPGVTRSNMPVTGAAPSSGLSFRGMNARQNRFLVDGLDNSDLGTGSFGCPLSQGAVREFQVITGAFPAEYGRATGGIVNSLLKSGTQQTEGSLFGFHRPGQWDARTPEGHDHWGTRQEQYGGTLGGALIPDRLFYFVSAEHYRKRDLKEVSIDSTQALPIVTAAGFTVENGGQLAEERETTSLLKLDYHQDHSRWGFWLAAGDGLNEDQVPWGGIRARSAGGTRAVQNLSVALSHQWLGGLDWVNESRLMFARQHGTLKSMDPARAVSVEITGVAQFGTHRLTPQDTHAEYVQFTDTATFSLGAHTLKAGFDLFQSRNRGDVEQNTAGAYTFQAVPGFLPDALTAFAGGFPVAYLQSWGTPSTRFKTESLAVFLQDEWEITPRFMLKAGLRYDREALPVFEDCAAYQDLQQPPATVDPVYGPVRLPDGIHPYSELFKTQRDWSSHQLSPRVSFSWKARDPLRVYGGYGVHAGSTQLGSLFGPRLYNNREVQTFLYTFLDDYARMMQGLAPNLPAYWGSPGHRLPGLPAGAAPMIVIPGTYGMPTTRTWNLGLEWAGGKGHRFTLDLLHSRGRGFMNIRDVNAYVPHVSPVLGQTILRRPDLRFSQILRIDGSGESRYWGQTLGWQWRANDALSLDLSYTHSRAEDNYSDWNPDFPLQDSYDPGQEWGPSSEDQTHQVQLSGVYRTRSGHPFLRGWTVSVIAQHASGRPYSQLAGYDRNQNGDGTSDRPAGVGRNRERGPATTQVDLRLSKGMNAGPTRMDLTFEIFNLFNTVNVTRVQNVLTARVPHAYGTPLGYGAMREFQFGIKLNF